MPTRSYPSKSGWKPWPYLTRKLVEDALQPPRATWTAPFLVKPGAAGSLMMARVTVFCLHLVRGGFASLVTLAGTCSLSALLVVDRIAAEETNDETGTLEDPVTVVPLQVHAGRDGREDSRVDSLPLPQDVGRLQDEEGQARNAQPHHHQESKKRVDVKRGDGPREQRKESRKALAGMAPAVVYFKGRGRRLPARHSVIPRLSSARMAARRQSPGVFRARGS